MPIQLTDKAVLKILADARKSPTPVRVRDSVEAGLRLVAGPRGGTWSYTASIGKGGDRVQKTITIGSTADISLAEARVEVAKLKASVRAGVDPSAERVLADARRTTLGIEAAKWQPRGRARSAYNDRNQLGHALREMGLTDSPPDALTRRDLMRLVELHRGRPGTVRMRLGALRRFYDSLVHSEIVEVNPVRLLPAGVQPAPPAPRSGYPTAVEVQRLWTATEKVDETMRPGEARDILRLLMLVPLRRNEASTLKAGEVDLERAEIRLAPNRTKNGKGFVMPLSQQALDILAPRVKGHAPDAPVFGAGTFSWWRPLDRWRRLAGVPTFAPHDLRRLFASECGEHGIGDFDLIDGLLAHSGSASRPGVVGTYQRAARTAERRDIMQAWADLVMQAVETGRWKREVETTVSDIGKARKARAAR